MPPTRATAIELRQAFAAGRVAPTEVTKSLLEMIGNEDKHLGAWVDVQTPLGLASPAGLATDTVGAPLFGVPVGVKDVLDTKDLRTEYGSEIYRRHRPVADAACVARLREAGALIIGKTATTEFSTRRPAATRNPLNRAHTPGGSSSGSAAAVAAGMVPLAVGTQTLGSVIRPAAYCGVFAIKPSFGIVNRLGTKLLSESVDTIGFFARSLSDLALITGAAASDPKMIELAFGGPAKAARLSLAFCRSPQWEHASEAMRAFFLSVQGELERRGHALTIELPEEFAGLDIASDAITEFETWHSLAHERVQHGPRCSPALRDLFARGGRRRFDEAASAREHAERARITLDALFQHVDCLVTPSTPGEAPVGLEDTGSPVFNKIWTLLHVPSVNVPAGKAANGLPFGLQVIARRCRDDVALAGAEQLRVLLRQIGA
ncbi:MAG: amidase [Proteobacteria bacterium]|nr:amidase [Pseudomonadota bacterium]